MTTGYVEQLALRYFGKKGYIVQPSVWFQLDKAKTGKKVGGWSDIDLVALSQQELVIIQCKAFFGVKKAEAVVQGLVVWFRQAESFLRKDPMWKPWLEGREIVKCMVVDHFVKKAERLLSDQGIQILLYEDVLKELLLLLQKGKARKGKEDDAIIRLLVAMIDKGFVCLDE